MRNKGRERGRKDRRKEVRREDRKLAACFMFTLSWLSNAFLSLMKCKPRHAINSHCRVAVAGSLQAGPHCCAHTTPSTRQYFKESCMVDFSR